MKIIIKVLLIVIVLFIIFKYVFGIHVVKTVNMFPSIKPGELVIYYKLNKEYYNNDVIVYNNNLYRIVGISNDDINIENGNLIINNFEEENEIYFNTNIDSKTNIKYPYIVKENEYFIMNDYRLELNDSRLFGSISKNKIDGLIIASIQIRDF